MPKFNIQAQAIPTVASAYADVIGTTDNQIVEIKNEQIIENNHQKFKIHEETIEQLAERILNDGQLSPCIVAPLPNGKYELIDGRHRRRAIIKAGLPTTKCIIKSNLTDKEKKTIQLTSNLIRNNDYLPSELAYAYKELAEIEDLKTISEETNMNKKKIYRYIRLTNLIEPLLNRVDSGAIPVIAAVELSYVSREVQSMVFQYMLNNPSFRITTENARIIKHNGHSFPTVLEVIEENEKRETEKRKLTEESDVNASINELAAKTLKPYSQTDEADNSSEEVDNLSTEKTGEANEQKKKTSGSKSSNTKTINSENNEADEAPEVDKLSTQEEEKQAIEPNARFTFEKDDILFQDSEGNPHNIKEIDNRVLKHICEYVIEESKMDYYVFRFAYDAREILSLWKQTQISADWNYSSKHMFRIEIEGQYYFFLHTMLEKTVRRYIRDNYTVERIKKVVGE